MRQPVVLLLFCSLLLTACVSSPPRQLDNICTLFKEKKSWYKHARKSQKRWGSTVATSMAIMHQESRFRARAKPPRTKILWVIPGPRKSDAYGYSQAKTATWNWYKKSSGNRGADRDNFADAIDFIGWYNQQTHRQNGVALDNSYALYLAYHEGHGGYRRGSYKNKNWLIKVAKKVRQRAQTYQRQLNQCEQRLRSRRWPLSWF
ncbi:MAG: transglycosylase SLT domain-containing protein [Cellvibrionaceae bacterium]|nr:transglycosylase SLT domain-containing protein [Cellvibrionaceae bacterium]